MVEHTFRGDVQRTVDHELDDDELLDHVRNLAQEKLTLVEEVQQYANSESEVSSEFSEDPCYFSSRNASGVAAEETMLVSSVIV